jgi:SH3 domain-containing YSC84-like protein 1
MQMKKLAMCCAFCLVAASAFAALSKDEVKRLYDSATIVGELRNADNGIPEDLWSKAECVLVIPSMKKAAFIVGGEYGSGVMSCHRGNAWSAPVFMQLMKGSWGLQIGAESVDVVILAMNRRGVDKLLENKVSLGADISVAAGPVGRTASAATDGKLSAELLSYSRAQGLFAGVNLSGGALLPDKEANERAYGPNLTARNIVDGKGNIKMAAEAGRFVKELEREVRSTTGAK